MKQRQVIKVIYENGETTIRMYGLRRFFRKFRTNKKYKDRLFIRLFQEKKELLKLYNAVNHSDSKVYRVL
ncbi:MAG: hypothetical protein PHC41_09545 [Lachnospiraceae bacterium]|nr:hypothetical protein [Lachnospiraceae bacterium]MDD3616453.1 hypothetical protein [Lachnospiraceae bacterium]